MIRRRRLNNDYVGKGGYPLGCLGGNLGFGSEILSGSVSHRTKSGASSSFSFSFSSVRSLLAAPPPPHHTTTEFQCENKKEEEKNAPRGEKRREEKETRKGHDNDKD